MSGLGAPGRLRRLDPRSLVSRLLSLSSLRQRWGLLVALLAGFGISGRFRLVTVVLGVVVLVAVTLGSALVEWLRFEYAVADGRLVVQRGLLQRSLTVVPLDRIRGVDVHSSAVQRVLGIAVLRVDAAATGGRHDEAVLDAVSVPEAARLRRLLLREVPVAVPSGWAGVPGGWAGAPPAPGDPGRPWPAGASAPGAAGAGTPEEPAVVLAKLRPAWLFYAPLVGSYLLAPVAAVAALQQYLDDLHIPWFDRLADRIGGSRFGPLEVAGLVAAALAVCAVGAVATAAVTNWGFTLSRRGGSLVSERGLLSRRQVSLEVARIRGYSLARPLSLRLVRAARLTALVTGLGGENTRRGQLLPLGPAAVATAVADQILPFTGVLRRHPAAARRRRLLRATLPWLPLAGAAVALRWWWVAAGLAGVAVLGVPLALDRYRGLGHGLDDRGLAVRSGSLRRHEVVLDQRGVVGWQVRQTFFQRRAGLATVTAGTGAGAFEIIDVGAGDAVGVLHAVSPRQTADLAADP
ncbi:MAG: putative rane protein [Mycobacteriales bacterium]